MQHNKAVMQNAAFFVYFCLMWPLYVRDEMEHFI